MHITTSIRASTCILSANRTSRFSFSLHYGYMYFAMFSTRRIVVRMLSPAFNNDPDKHLVSRGTAQRTQKQSTTNHYVRIKKLVSS